MQNIKIEPKSMFGGRNLRFSISMQKVSYGRREVAAVRHRAHSADGRRGQAVLREMLLIPNHIFSILDHKIDF